MANLCQRSVKKQSEFDAHIESEYRTSLPGKFPSLHSLVFEQKPTALIALNQRLAVIGCGFMGIMCIQLIKIMGASSITVLDIIPWRVNAARESGAQHAVNTKDIAGNDIAKELGEFDVVVEAAVFGVKDLGVFYDGITERVPGMVRSSTTAPVLHKRRSLKISFRKLLIPMCT